MVTLPPEINIERSPWDPEEVRDMNLKTLLPKRHSIRNRIYVDDAGEQHVQTNAALVEYADGSVRLMIGKRPYECRVTTYKSQMHAGEIFTEIQTGNTNEKVLQKVGDVNSKITVRPRDLSAAINMKKTEKRKVERTVFTVDELDEKKAFAEYRATQLEERKKAKQMSERFPTRSFANFLENSDEDDFDAPRGPSRFENYDDDEMAERLESAKSARGRAMPKRTESGRKRRAEEFDDEEEGEEDDEGDLDGFIVNDEDEEEETGGFGGGSRGKRRRVVDDDEDE
jgi:hypothetical protein